jgi:two-component system, response regulator PdtaR
MWKNSMRARYQRANRRSPDTLRNVSYLNEEPPLTSLLAPPKRILTVEDNAIVSADVRTILETAGYDVLPEARDGEQAVEHVQAYAPDLILLDLTLPRLDGIETANRIRAASDAPILVLTGSSDAETLERAAAAGSSGLVRKPFSANGLLAAVRSRLAPSESDDFAQRCLVEQMVREGADERAITRALRARLASDASPAHSDEPRRNPWRKLPFVRRRARGPAAA